MAKWQLTGLEIPDELQPLVDTAADLADTIADFLELAAETLNIIKNLAVAAIDLYRAIVNEFIDTAQAFINDIRFAGVYVLLDYPQSFWPGEEDGFLFEKSDLAGTLVDPDVTSGKRDPNNKRDLQAILSKRRSFEPVSKDIISFSDATDRLVDAFDDRQDDLRPQFSNDAQMVAVIVMVYNESFPAFVSLVRSLTNLVSFRDLDNMFLPGGMFWLDNPAKEGETILEKFGNDVADASVSVLEAFERSLEDGDFSRMSIPFSARGSGGHPNFVARVTIQDLFPTLGEALRRLNDLLELLRPNGDISEYIDELIQAVENKIARLLEIAELLRQLSAALRNGVALPTLVVSSNEGQKGLQKAIASATGGPEFEKAFVASVMMVAGGPSAAPLAALFSGDGTDLPNQFEDNRNKRDQEARRPVLEP